MSRQDQDNFAAESFARAKAAAATGAFDAEIVPVQARISTQISGEYGSMLPLGPHRCLLVSCFGCSLRSSVILCGASVCTGAEGQGKGNREQGRDSRQGQHGGAAGKVRTPSPSTQGAAERRLMCINKSDLLPSPPLARRLGPAFQKQGGTVTAGNSSGINDGAAALVLARTQNPRPEPHALVLPPTRGHPPIWTQATTPPLPHR